MVPFVPLVGYAAVLALFVLLDDLWFRGDSLWRRPLLWAGLLGTAGFSLAMTFDESWNRIWDRPGGDPSVPVLGLRWALFALLLGAFAWAFWTQSKRRREQAMAPRWHLVWALFPIVIALGGVLPAMGRGFDVSSVVLLNGYLLAVGLLTLLDGIRLSSLAVTNLGMATLLVLLVARFFDWEIGFVARGLLFIALGSGFLLFNVLWMRRNKEALP